METATAAYVLILFNSERITAIATNNAYGDNYRFDLFRHKSTQVDDRLPMIITDAATNFCVGGVWTSDFGRSDAIVWWEDGTITALERDGFTHATVLGTNGEILVGRRSKVGDLRASVWDTDGHLISDLDPIGMAFSQAEDIANDGTICGIAGNKVTGDAYIWTDPDERQGQWLTKPGWATDSWAYGVASRGLVVGEASNLNRTRPILWLDNQVLELADLLGSALETNEAGQIVGWTKNPDNPLTTIGVMWYLNGGLTPVDLNNLIEPTPNIQIITAYDIDDRGNIAVECLNLDTNKLIGGVLVNSQGITSNGNRTP